MAFEKEYGLLLKYRTEYSTKYLKKKVNIRLHCLKTYQRKTGYKRLTGLKQVTNAIKNSFFVNTSYSNPPLIKVNV